METRLTDLLHWFGYPANVTALLDAVDKEEVIGRLTTDELITVLRDFPHCREAYDLAKKRFLEAILPNTPGGESLMQLRTDSAGIEGVREEVKQRVIEKMSFMSHEHQMQLWVNDVDFHPAIKEVFADRIKTDSLEEMAEKWQTITDKADLRRIFKLAFRQKVKKADDNSLTKVWSMIKLEPSLKQIMLEEVVKLA